MIKLKHLSFVFALSAVLLAVGTGALSAASIERGVEVSVANDENAYLGLNAHEQTLTYGQTSAETAHGDVSLLTIENQFGTEAITLTVTDVSDGVPHVTAPSRILETDLAPGENTTVSVPVVCSASGDGTLDLHVTASTGSTTVEKTKPIPVTCTKNNNVSAPNATVSSGNASGQPPDERG